MHRKHSTLIWDVILNNNQIFYTNLFRVTEATASLAIGQILAQRVLERLD